MRTERICERGAARNRKFRPIAFAIDRAASGNWRWTGRSPARIRPRGQEESERSRRKYEFPAAENNIDCCKYCSSALPVRHSYLAAAPLTRTMGHLSGRRPTHWRTNLPAKGVQPVPFRSWRWSEASPRSGFAGGGRIQHERVSHPDVESRATHVGTIKDQQHEFSPVYGRRDGQPICLPLCDLLRRRIGRPGSRRDPVHLSLIHISEPTRPY